MGLIQWIKRKMEPKCHRCGAVVASKKRYRCQRCGMAFQNTGRELTMSFGDLD